MKNKSIEEQTRGWLPKDPVLFTPNRARYGRKLGKWIANPFSTLGGLMIVASLLSAVFGGGLVSVYLTLLFGQEGTIYYAGLYIGIIGLASFALGLYSGILLLTEKHINRAVTATAIILCCGIVTLLLPMLEGQPVQSGLIVASPMLFSTLTTLTITLLNKRNQKIKPIIPTKQLTAREQVFAGLGVAGGGLTVVGIVLHFIPMHLGHLDEAGLFIGVPLLVAAVLVRITYKH
ncbi:MAG: hypothetical protein ACQCN3_15110 [Candidatus Bathyarchaeia archaeon]|jgi:hypothetical protein